MGCLVAVSSDDGKSLVTGCNSLIVLTMSVSFLLVVCFLVLVLKKGLLRTDNQLCRCFQRGNESRDSLER